MDQLFSADQTSRLRKSGPTLRKETWKPSQLPSQMSLSQQSKNHPQPQRCKRRFHISICDFNAHSTSWGYENNNQDGDEVETWLESKHLTLIHNAKLPKSFHSARWKRGYNPDLACVSSDIASRTEKKVLDPIPHTQLRPIAITVRSALQATTVPFRRRFNLQKADWLSFQ
ncbi:hypothetical protein CgunFtcFv8_020501 [Champsocephalus gunnari]|uniref:Endonuclease/exonuclease/phosphatase domain-containing protein n=1 Tax=Champsocephalus gunnari TaxID=52237 RepID=A0AAN8E4M7_CHAGU|nr:hypothetical protein CgunFtcFv8_020501 [Champsocephalus gunnari]